MILPLGIQCSMRDLISDANHLFVSRICAM